MPRNSDCDTDMNVRDERRWRLHRVARQSAEGRCVPPRRMDALSRCGQGGTRRSPRNRRRLHRRELSWPAPTRASRPNRRAPARRSLEVARAIRVRRSMTRMKPAELHRERDPQGVMPRRLTGLPASAMIRLVRRRARRRAVPYSRATPAATVTARQHRQAAERARWRARRTAPCPASSACSRCAACPDDPTPLSRKRVGRSHPACARETTVSATTWCSSARDMADGAAESPSATKNRDSHRGIALATLRQRRRLWISARNADRG